ncbi:MAG: DNA-3-methyladenine glycosylase I [Proteobacteria bacterium]|nr:MAG: DNA-3-methyladenine glycosylase I [Pseudomonadota bacterium]
MNWYCDYAIDDPLHGSYHDTEYGFPLDDEARLFERLVLEINQAGLSWGLMLKKRDAFFNAYEGYDVARIARYDAANRKRLLKNAAIIRNRLKVDAVIHNAGVVEAMRDSHGGFSAWLKAHHPLQKKAWVKRFRETFKFTGGEITGEFLMSTGYLPGTHRPSCPAYARILAANPPWLDVGEEFYASGE